MKELLFMKKKILLGMLALLLAISLAAVGCPAPTPTPTPTPTPVPTPVPTPEPEVIIKETMHIRFAAMYPPLGLDATTVYTPMLDELVKRSDGRITYTTYYGSALCAGPDHYDAIANGIADMGHHTLTWTPGRFPLTDVLSIANWIPGKEIAADIGNAMYERILHVEFPDVKVLCLNGCITGQMYTKEPVHTLEDATGLKLRTPGGFHTLYQKALGIEPVHMPLGDVFLSVETGVVDGLTACPPTYLGFKLYEVAPYVTSLAWGCVGEGQILMNLDSWERTPDDLKPIIEEVCSNPFRITGGLTSEVYAGLMEEIVEEHGVKLYTLPEEEAERWYVLFQQVTRDWVADLEAKGLPAEEAVKMWYEECQKWGAEVIAMPPEWQ